MGNFAVPSKPSIPQDTSNQKAMLEYQEQMFNYQFALQIHQSTLSQEEGARSNMAKSEHDAMMSVVNNLKA